MIETMELLLKRIALKDTYTIGKLYVNGKYECDTLEPKVRDLTKEPKVIGKTAIPYGTYPITLKIKSQKFSQVKTYEKIDGYLPRLLRVPFFKGVLIHIGNTIRETRGCILVGLNQESGKVLYSRKTFWKLYPKLKKAAGRGEKIVITIE